eukprot:TRINITY_DN28685_c0_g1_i1.p1 TRINITY_DN28685_c0_g1~~TRINITY_DN28685_c0_g1_i1.p1  ORF type:complete len:373 (+),score=47.40 TRINITY_DN28685_c0_g1_i1:60-1178(+)
MESSSFKIPDQVLGDVLVVSACFTSCLGVNLQKWAHLHNDGLPSDKSSTVYLNIRWIAGIVLMIAGSLMDLAALPLIPLSRVAALGSMTLVANVVVTPWFLKEKLTTHDKVGCLVTIAGSATACFFGSASQPTLTLELLFVLLSSSLFLEYMAVVVILLSVLYCIIREFSRKEQELTECGILGGEGQPKNLECLWAHSNLDIISESDSRLRFVTSCGPQYYGFVHASFSGIVGGHSIMLAKASMVLVPSILNYEAAAVFCTLVILAVTVFAVWAQIHFLNRTLQIYRDVLFVFPVYQASWVISGVTSGLIYYQEYKHITDTDLSAFLLGVAITLSGLSVLALRSGGMPAAKTLSPVGRSEKGVNEIRVALLP